MSGGRGRWARAALATSAAALVLGSCARPRPPANDAIASATASGVSDARPVAEPLRSAAVRDTLRRVLDAAVGDRAFPGAFAAVGDHGGVIAQYGAGRIDWASDAPTPDENTIWDLASLTKVVAVTSAVAQLAGERRVALDAPVQRYLPEWTGANKERVLVRHLLTHSSGLPAWRPLHKEAESAESARALIYATELDTVPGVRYVYSDLGAFLLGQIVERVSGERLDAYLTRRVFGPLAMRDTRYLPEARERARTAPTEFDPWRQRLVRGEVHDENAFALGGVAGHAGLFSTGRDLARFARMYLHGGALDGARVLDSAVVREFTRRQSSLLSHRALGWETPTGQNSAGHRLSAGAFGHTGFTGTSLWIDPAQDLFVILLTNRVNPSRQNTRIGAVRVALTDAVVAALGAAAQPPAPSGP